MAALLTPSVTAGSTRLAMPLPATGSHCNCTANSNSSSRPSQKWGMEMPRIEVTISEVSSQDPCR